MPLIPSQLSFLPPFEGRERLYSSISLGEEQGELTLGIRILTIRPNHDYLAPIDASLSIIESLFEEHEKYNAVSYYWGDFNQLENVIIHGSDKGETGFEFKVPVTKNITAALRQFRAKASANKEPLRLWIDALCINQNNASERWIQVFSMGWIFLGAESVWIWLGESEELVERGLAALIGQAISYASFRKTGAAMPPHHFLSSTLSLDEEALYIKQFTAIYALPYWRRGWTFQENVHPNKYICQTWAQHEKYCNIIAVTMLLAIQQS